MIAWGRENPLAVLAIVVLLAIGVTVFVLVRRRRAQVPVVAAVPSTPVKDPAAGRPILAFDAPETRSGLSGLGGLPIVILGEASDG